VSQAAVGGEDGECRIANKRYRSGKITKNIESFDPSTSLCCARGQAKLRTGIEQGILKCEVNSHSGGDDREECRMMKCGFLLPSTTSAPLSINSLRTSFAGMTMELIID